MVEPGRLITLSKWLKRRTHLQWAGQYGCFSEKRDGSFGEFSRQKTFGRCTAQMNHDFQFTFANIEEQYRDCT